MVHGKWYMESGIWYMVSSKSIRIIPDPELRPILVHSQLYLEFRMTSFELAVICPG